jgi:transcription elongation factor Elf1
MTVDALTAEWNCTRCGTTNRKLVPLTDQRATDRCSHCRTRHTIEPDTRRVRWVARQD